MMPTDTHNRQVVLKRRPVGAPTVDDFAMVELPVPQPSDGEVLTRTAWLSLDPYMRGRMSDRKSYAPSVPLGGVMVARTVSRVIESRDPRFAPGDIVLGPGGWQDYAALPAASLRKLDPEAAPVSTALGVLGMPGMTAYVGLLDLGRPRAGETVVVSAASGAVGSVAGQIARIRGCRVVGSARSSRRFRLPSYRRSLGYRVLPSSERATRDVARILIIGAFWRRYLFAGKERRCKPERC